MKKRMQEKSKRQKWRQRERERERERKKERGDGKRMKYVCMILNEKIYIAHTLVWIPRVIRVGNIVG